MTRAERIAEITRQYCGKDDEESLIEEDVVWLLTQLEREVERSRKLREVLVGIADKKTDTAGAHSSRARIVALEGVAEYDKESSND